jgi:hypothetical protein
MWQRRESAAGGYKRAGHLISAPHVSRNSHRTRSRAKPRRLQNLSGLCQKALWSGNRDLNPCRRKNKPQANVQQWYCSVCIFVQIKDPFSHTWGLSRIASASACLLGLLPSPPSWGLASSRSLDSLVRMFASTLSLRASSSSMDNA